MTSYLDWELVANFKENYWSNGWALGPYSVKGQRSQLGKLVYAVKYGQETTDDFGARSKAAQDILDTVKQFIKIKYPVNGRPFDVAICPPSNLEKKFDLTHYITSHLTAGGIRDCSDSIRKTRALVPMKNLTPKQRAIELAGAYEFVKSDKTRLLKGILIVDDVLDTGATSREICKVLEEALPGIPKYYLAVTYILDQ